MAGAGRRLKSLIVAGGAAVLAALLTFIPFVWPMYDVPEQADAIIVLSGDQGERRAEAFRLLGRGVAPRLVFVGTPDIGDEDNLCRNGWRTREVICLRPDPDGTLPEARATDALAQTRGWKRVVVVTTTYHTVRAGLLFRRCMDADVAMVAARRSASIGETARQTVREWLATAYFAVLERGC